MRSTRTDSARARSAGRTIAIAPVALLAVAGLALAAGAAAAQAPDGTAFELLEGPAFPLTLEEAVARALEKNEGILIERASLDSAAAAIEGAEGAYDPLLGVEAGWRRASPPVNSAFSGAPGDELAPTVEGVETSASLEQLLPTGGLVSVTALTARGDSNASFDLLSPTYDSQLGVELRQPLLRNRELDAARFQIRVAAADRDRAAASLEREVSDTVAAVEQAYWMLVAVRREIEVREEAVALADEQLSETSIRIESGASPETEVAQPRAELERRRGDLLAAREAVARAESRLKLLILGDDDADLWARPLVPVAEAEVDAEPVDVVAAMERALENRAEVGAAAAVVERRRVESAFARDEVRPALDLVVSYDRFGLAGSRNPRAGTIPGLPTDVATDLEGNLGDSLEQLVDGDFDDARIALVLGLPIGNRTAKANARIAANSERQAAADLVRVRKSIRAQVLDAAAALETARARIEAARAAREAAAVQLEAERERFAVGLSTNFLVLTRQNDLAGARLDEIAAGTDFRAARTEMARATGSLLGERGIELQVSSGSPSN